MAGYSGAPLPRKLGIRAGDRLCLVGEPDDFVATLGDLPEGVVRVTPPGPIDVAVVFAAWEATLVPAVASVREGLTPDGALWIAWPKKASKRPTDLVEDRLRALYLPTGLVDNKVCALDDVWSGLRFVLRKALRPKG